MEKIELCVTDIGIPARAPTGIYITDMDILCYSGPGRHAFFDQAKGIFVRSQRRGRKEYLPGIADPDAHSKGSRMYADIFGNQPSQRASILIWEKSQEGAFLIC
jgi:hypothetical protein